MAVNEHHYCMCPAPENLPQADQDRLASRKAAVLNAFKWDPGSTITIRFLEGDPGLCARVKAVAQEWIAPGMANLFFSFRIAGQTHIRISFEKGNGSWSYIGTMCKQVPEPKPTMNYGWLTPTTPDAELRRVVLHEFGHALGLIHEHQSPVQGIRWNEPAVVADLSQPPNSWNLATIKNNMFKKYNQGEVNATPVDSKSIMMYPIPKAWTLDGFSAGMNGDLSPLDKQMIRSAYP